ncbi:MAG: hypothetical protein K2H25_00820, partial [Alistipes sp.]|nr:hypothetical protein [Alistipes sp.]
MKKWSFLSGFVALTAVLGGCTSAYYTSAGYAGDDLYATHDKVQIARRQQQEAEARKAAAEARRAEWEARIAEAEALAAQNEYEGTVSSGRNTYSSVLADTYESAYARRLRGFESPTYRMPSSYYNFRYGDTFTYVSAYDPAFYNIVVSGDQVWVEPKYISSMFGTWGATVYTGNWYGGWSVGWGFGSSWWRYPSWGWNWGFAYHPWHDPWYRPGWGPAWGPSGWHGHWTYRRPHNYRLDSYSRPNNNGWRQPVGTGTSRNEGYGRGYNTGRTGSYNNSGRGSSYNNRGTGNRNNGYNNSGTRNDRNNNATRPANNDRNNNTTRPSGNNDRNSNSYN